MRLLQLNDADNTSIVLEEDPGETSVHRGHKVASQAIACGTPILKYGQVIGLASRDIDSGEHVHVHNCCYVKKTGSPHISSDVLLLRKKRERSFNGYLRPDGRTGTRNYIGVIASVNCAATVVQESSRIATQQLMPRFANIDGIVPITHGSGCGMTGEGGEGFELLRRTLRGYATHPNFGGVLMIGLGCEVNQLSNYQDAREENFDLLSIQEAGGVRPAIQEAVERIEHLAQQAERAERSQRPISEIVLGLQCGGSDSFSAITCNPALGVASDLLVQHGGSSLLSETPEIIGAEHLLTARMDEREQERLLALIDWWENYARSSGASLNNNPSPGNKAGGLTTIIEKSLGAVSKAGQSRFASVISYAESPSKPGLSFMDSPGYDPVSATGQIAAGANLVAFTTGRGSCFGSKPTPTFKLSSTSELYRDMPDDIDIDCGPILSGEVSLARMGEEIFDDLIEVASGRRTKSELNGLGDLEFVPWRVGAVL